MRRLVSCLGLGALAALAGAGCRAAPGLGEARAARSVEVPRLPTDLEAFVAYRDAVATEPAGGAAALVVALTLYAENQDLGLSCLTAVLDPGRLQDGTAWEGKEPIEAAQRELAARVAGKPQVPRACFLGATPANGYALGDAPYRIEVTEVRTNGDTAKVFVRCSGAEAPRPVTLKQSDGGVWKAHEWSSLEVGVRPPTETPDEDS